MQQYIHNNWSTRYSNHHTIRPRIQANKIHAKRTRIHSTLNFVKKYVSQEWAFFLEVWRHALKKENVWQSYNVSTDLVEAGNMVNGGHHCWCTTASLQFRTFGVYTETVRFALFCFISVFPTSMRSDWLHIDSALSATALQEVTRYH